MSVESIITENLDVWTSAIKTKSASGRGSSKKLELFGIKKLRELILDLAVRGKLVQQDPNDEPTSKLIGRIKFEQDKLVEEQTIKRLKPLPPISNEEKTFQLPENWEWCRIGSLFNSIVSGGTPSKREPTYWNGDIPWASVKDLGNELFLSKTQDYITQKGLIAGSKLAEKGNLLICTRMGLGKIAIVDVPMAFNQDLKAVAVSKQIDLGFFINAFKTIKIEGTGTTVAGITQEQLTNYPIALPPYNEQVRIVAKIDALMALCDQLESQTEASIEAHQTLVKSLLGTLTNAKDSDELNESWQRISEHFDVLFTTEDSIDQLKQTILQLAVMGKLVKQDSNDEPASKLLERIAAEKEQLIKDKKIKKQKKLPPITDELKNFSIPPSWRRARFESIFYDLKYGTSKKSDYDIDGSAVLRIPNIVSGEVTLDDLKFSKMSEDEVRELKLCKGDLLFIRSNGSLGIGGRSTLVENDLDKFVYAGYLVRARLPVKNVSSEFITLLMKTRLLRDQIEKPIRTTTGVKNINSTELGLLYFPLPPLNEQNRIVEKVEQLGAVIKRLTAGVQNLNYAKCKLCDFVEMA